MGFGLSHSGWLKGAGVPRTIRQDPGYYIALGIGAMVGAILFGSANMRLAGLWPLGHSIAGAIAGGIVAVEGYKFARGIRGSTGFTFVAPLALGIAVGRLGCFFAGLPDYTYGIATNLPWAVDFGDGIPRHPVQLYESAAMAGFLAVFLWGAWRRKPLFLRHGFYIFTGWYGIQRFVWEFFKPYPTLIGPFNIFHLVCAGLVLYSVFMIGRNDDIRTPV